MERATVGGIDVAYQRAGSGPPLTLLHGFIADSRYWRPQIEDLSRDFDVIAWDTPGCGRSSDPPEPFGMPEYAHCLAEFLDSLGVESTHIVGLSWGGTLAQEFYGRHRERVISLVLADTYAGWKGSLSAEAVEDRVARCQRDSELPPHEWVPGWIPELLTDDAPEELRREVVSALSDFHPAGYRVMTRAVADADTSHLHQHIRVPTLLIWGEDDRRSPVAVGEAIRDGIPGSRLVSIPGAGHLSSAEQPERFNAAVREFCHPISN